LSYDNAQATGPGLRGHTGEAASRAGREVSVLCGKKVAARTVVVQMLFPRMLPSASLSESVVFAGRFADGYRVWYVAH
jgi:hypothetical protein